jgi:hypothetical protein
LSELIHAVGEVPGVQRVVELHLLDDDGRQCLAASGDRAAWRVPYLVVPAEQSDIRLDLRLAGQARPVVVSDFRDRFARLRFAADSRRHTQPAGESVSPLPEGAPADFAEYTTVQQHFPPVYGLGSNAPPESAPPERRAQARQLQGYLLLFDQLMANFMQGVQGWPRLFSLDSDLDRSYFHQTIDEAVLPGVGAFAAARPPSSRGCARPSSIWTISPTDAAAPSTFCWRCMASTFAQRPAQHLRRQARGAGPRTPAHQAGLCLPCSGAQRAPPGASTSPATRPRQRSGAGREGRPAAGARASQGPGDDGRPAGEGFRHLSDAELLALPGVDDPR